MSMTTEEYMRYLGCLGLLSGCSVHVTDEIRDSIERAFTDACAAHPTLRWRRILDLYEIESIPSPIIEASTEVVEPSWDPQPEGRTYRERKSVQHRLRKP